MAEHTTTDYLAALEADRTNTGEPPTTTARLRRALFAGEWLHVADVVERFGGSNGLLHMTMRDMEWLGFKFDSEVGQAPTGHKRTSYKLRNPQHRVTDAAVQEMRGKRYSKRGKRKPKSKAPRGSTRATLGLDVSPAASATENRRGRRPHKPPLPVLPEMGSTLTVTMLAIDPDTGLARIGLRNGVHAYEVTVDVQR